MKQETLFRADSGKIHETAFEALKDDLCHRIAALAGNDPIAKQVTTGIVENLEEFATLLDHLRCELPSASVATPAPHARRVRFDDTTWSGMAGDRP